MSRSETAFLPATQATPSLSVVFGKHQSQKQFLPLAAKPKKLLTDFPVEVGFSLPVLAGWDDGVVMSILGRVQAAFCYVGSFAIYKGKPPGGSSSAAMHPLKEL